MHYYFRPVTSLLILRPHGKPKLFFLQRIIKKLIQRLFSINQEWVIKARVWIQFHDDENFVCIMSAKSTNEKLDIAESLLFYSILPVLSNTTQDSKFWRKISDYVSGNLEFNEMSSFKRPPWTFCPHQQVCPWKSLIVFFWLYNQ